MLPGFPPGIFPFWGPFPAVPPPAAPPAATDAPQSSTEAPQASGEHLPFSCQREEKPKSPTGFTLFCIMSSFQVPVSPLRQTQTLVLLLPPRRDRQCLASPSPCLPLPPSPLHHGDRCHHFLPLVSTSTETHVNNKTSYLQNRLEINQCAWSVLFKSMQGATFMKFCRIGTWLSALPLVYQSKSGFYFVSSSVIDAPSSPFSVSTVRGGAEGHGGRGAAGAGGQATVSPEHPHPPGRRHAQHPPLPQHRHHTHVTATPWSRRQIKYLHNLIKPLKSSAVDSSPPRADGGPDVSTSHIHSSPVVGSSTDVQRQEDAPGCEYAKQVSRGRAAESRRAKDLLLSPPAELPHAAEDAAASLDTERQTADEGAAADEEGEPSAAELRRRRLRKLASSPFTPPPPPENWPTHTDSLFSGPTGILSWLPGWLFALRQCNQI